MDGVILLDANAKPLLKSNFHNDSFPLAIVDALGAAISSQRAAPPSPCNGLQSVFWLPDLSPPSASNQSRTSYDSASSSGDSHSDAPPALPDGTGPQQASGADLETASLTCPPAALAQQGTMCCHMAQGGLRFVCAAGPQVSAPLVFAFLSTFAALLQSYFKNLSPAVVQDNFDTITLLLDAALSSTTRLPVFTDPSLMRELVVPPSLLAKVMSAVAAVGVSSMGSASGYPFTTAVPWRPTGIRYQSNELYLDLVEIISGVMDRNGRAVFASASGSVECKCKLSGMPDLLLTFTQPNAVVSPCFHPCVRYAKWSANQVVSFVPPDGRCTLMNFQFGPLSRFDRPSAQPLLGATVGGGLLPLTCRAVVTTGSAGGTFSLTLNSKLSPAATFSSVILELCLGAKAQGVQASVSGGRVLTGGPDVRTFGPRDGLTGSRGGTWEWDGVNKTLRWRLTQFSAAERPPTLSGTWEHSTPSNRPSPAIVIHFELASWSVTGLKVDKLKLLGESYSMFKGVRSRAQSGSLECRW